MIDDLFDDIAEVVDIIRNMTDDNGNEMQMTVKPNVSIAIIPDRTPRVNEEGYLLEQIYYDAIVSPPIWNLQDTDLVYRKPRSATMERGATPSGKGEPPNQKDGNLDYVQILAVNRNEIIEDVHRLYLEDTTKVQ